MWCSVSKPVEPRTDPDVQIHNGKYLRNTHYLHLIYIDIFFLDIIILIKGLIFVEGGERRGEGTIDQGVKGQ